VSLLKTLSDDRVQYGLTTELAPRGPACSLRLCRGAQEDQFTLEFRCDLRSWSQVGAAHQLCGPISRCPCSAHKR
jgi:hypothetical protein